MLQLHLYEFEMYEILDCTRLYTHFYSLTVVNRRFVIDYRHDSSYVEIQLLIENDSSVENAIQVLVSVHVAL